MLNNLQQLILNVIEENSVGSAGITDVNSFGGNTDFSAFNAPNPNANFQPETFINSDIKGDYAADKASKEMTSKRKKRKKPFKRKFPETLAFKTPKINRR